MIDLAQRTTIGAKFVASLSQHGTRNIACMTIQKGKLSPKIKSQKSEL